jgi:acetyl-CoA carboxylase biotin carboxylase subunit
MFANILIANRGAVASRIMRSCRKLGIGASVVYSPADATLPYVGEADNAIPIGESPAQRSYLDQDLIIAAARKAKADAIHPGYGFLSENPGFARKVEAAGMTFIGPSATMIEDMGEKTRARAIMREHGMPMAPSSELLSGAEEAGRAAARLGYPVLVKPANGGGGIGMIAARNADELKPAIEKAAALALRAFGDAKVYLERLVERPRHIEFQIAADKHGHACHLFERDCSIQRRHQKVIEETPAPALPRPDIEAVAEKVAAIVAGLGYSTVGTVEMLYEPQNGFAFLEMNTRLQVEHAITEAVTGTDLVEAQIRLAAGERLSDVIAAPLAVAGHAIEARVYAEDPIRFLPSPGTLAAFDLPSGDGIRVETGYAQGCTVTPFYDPLLAKVIAHGANRTAALERLSDALRRTTISGVRHNIPFLLRVLDNARFRDGDLDTGLTGEILSTPLKAAS